MKGRRDWQSNLKDSGKSGAFINVLGEGSMLMPLKSIQSSPRFDSGVFSSAGHDPIRKDVVELIYRIFEREGLSLVPVLTFDSRMEKIEFSSMDGNENVLTDRRGQSVAGENYPAYNPLSEQIQNRIVEVVQEVADRYRDRPSYRGLAIVCRPDAVTMLPGSRVAGYDAKTLNRFDSNIVDQSHAQPLVSPEQFPDWLNWRVDQMKQWYTRLQAATTGDLDDAQLFLALVDVLKNDEIQGLLSPSLHQPLELQDAFKKIGFGVELLNNEKITLMQPDQLAPLHSLPEKKTEVNVRNSQQWQDWFRLASNRAGLFLHRSSWARFEKLGRQFRFWTQYGADHASASSGSGKRLEQREIFDGIAGSGR